MTKHDYKQNAYFLVYLIRCVLNNRIPSKEKLDTMNFSQLYEVAQAHSLTAIITYALESADIEEEHFKEAKSKAVRKSIYFEIERTSILAEFEKSGIWYLPLKGIILKDYYPKSSMREMCDNDILVNREYMDKVKDIMLNLGYKFESDSTGHDISFSKPPVLNFEMHYELFHCNVDDNMKRYYSNISDRLICVGDFRRELSNEDFYIYITCHEYKHFTYSGTGLRSLVDAFVFLSKFENQLDWKYINTELAKLGIAEYETKRRDLVMKLFSNSSLNHDENDMLDYYIFSSTYGTLKNHVSNSLEHNKGGKIGYILRRIFLPLEHIKSAYPFFYKHKILLPVLPIYRLFHNLSKNKQKHINEIRLLIRK